MYAGKSFASCSPPIFKPRWLWILALSLCPGRLSADDAAAPEKVPQPPTLSAADDSSKDDIFDFLLRHTAYVSYAVRPGIEAHGTGWVLETDRRLMVTNDHVVTTP